MSTPEGQDLTLEKVQEAFFAELLNVPFHDHLGLALDRHADHGQPRVTISPRPEIAGAGGEHSPAAVYTLGEAASAVEMCEAIAPYALEMGMGAIFFTVAGSFRPRGRAVGKIGAVTELVKGIEQGDGEGVPRKAGVEVAAKVLREDGEPVGEQRFSFYVRFMEMGRMREMVRPESEVGRLVGP
jgi:hypothetical protein